MTGMATPIGICPFSGKRQFASEQHAKRAMRQAQRSRRGGWQPERVYDDCRCGFWHLTSEADRRDTVHVTDPGRRNRIVGEPVGSGPARARR